MENIPPLRVCRVCGLEAFAESDLELFIKSKKNLYGRAQLCKKCQTDKDHPKSKYLRKCVYCGLEAHTEADLELFTKNVNFKNGRNNQCKSCTNKRNLERRRNNPFHYLYLIKKSHCKKDNVPFNLTTKYLSDLWEKQDGKCSLSGLEMEKPYNNSDFDLVASLDRIKFDKGYIKGNVRWVINTINTFKGQKDDAFVYKVAEAIINHRNANISN